MTEKKLFECMLKVFHLYLSSNYNSAQMFTKDKGQGERAGENKSHSWTLWVINLNHKIFSQSTTCQRTRDNISTTSVVTQKSLSKQFSSPCFYAPNEFAMAPYYKLKLTLYREPLKHLATAPSSNKVSTKKYETNSKAWSPYPKPTSCSTSILQVNPTLHCTDFACPKPTHGLSFLRQCRLKSC